MVDQRKLFGPLQVEVLHEAENEEILRNVSRISGTKFSFAAILRATEPSVCRPHQHLPETVASQERFSVRVDVSGHFRDLHSPQSETQKFRASVPFEVGLPWAD